MHNLIDNRQIRVFISSTFQDMQDERDYLMKHTFPILRKLASERDVTLTELDLRWGITEEEAKSGKVVEICLREIENSIPFFIGIIGNRYGWVPEKKDLSENIIERFTDVNNYLERHLSVTEMEMQFGVLQRKEDMHAYFYIKEGEVSSKADNPEMLERLKKEVQASRYPSATYYSPEDLGIQVQQAFTDLLNHLFPEGHLSELEKERIGQRSFMNQLCQNYIRDDKNFQVLDEWMQDSSKSQLIISGEPGCGKSALVANYVKSINQGNEYNYEIVYYFIGRGLKSDIINIMTYIHDVICIKYGIENKLNHNSVSFRKAEYCLDKVLNEIKKKERPLLIVLDGVNNIIGNVQCDLFWGAFFRVKLLVTKTPEYDEITFSRGVNNISLDFLIPEQKKYIIKSYMKLYGKKFSQKQENQIVSCGITSNAHVLKCLLDELIICGTHDNLDQLIDYYVHTSNIADFYQLLLEQFENDFSIHLVQNVLCLIYISQNGLTEDEIMAHDLNCHPLIWSQLSCRMTSLFQIRNGLLSFSNSFFTETVKSRYLQEQEEYALHRDKLINILHSFDTVHAKRELSYQLMKSSRFEELYQFVLSQDIFHVLYNNAYDDLMEYWKSLILNGDYSLSSYSKTLGDNIDSSVLKELAHFCQRIGAPHDALLYSQLRLKLQNTEEEEASIYDDIAQIYEDLNDYSSAIKSQYIAIKVYQRVYNCNNRLAQNEMAYLYKRASRLYEATRKYKLASDYKSKEIEIRSLSWGKLELAMYIRSHAEQCLRHRRLKDALKWAEEAVALVPDNEYCLETLSIIKGK